MKHIKTYKLFESRDLDIKHLNKYNHSKELNSLFRSEREIFSSFLEFYFNSDIISKDERYALTLEFNNPIEYISENFFDKLKSRFDKAKEVSKEISDKAKSALEKIVDASKKATDFVLKIKDFISSQISNILGVVKDKLKNKFKADGKMMAKIKEISNREKNALISELKLCKEVVNFYKTEFKEKFTSQITNSLTNFLSSDTAVVESIINEANMIGKLVDGLSHIPPFNWLHQVQHMGEKGAQAAISILSNITKNLGGPEITLPVIAAVLGIAFEYNVKGLVKHGLLDIVETYAIPFIGIIIKLLGYIATFIAVVDLFDEITSSNSIRE